MRDRSIVVWAVLAVLLLVVLNLPEGAHRQVKSALREGVAPLQETVSGVVLDVKESFRSIRGLGGLLNENRKMAAELVILRNEVRDLRSLEQENTDLREQLQFARRLNRQLIPCEVIARDIAGWWQTVRLNRGTAEGIQPNMAVITPDGLAGKTTEVSPRMADVILISDRGSKVSARIARTGSFGVVTGQGLTVSGQVVCRMDFINKNTPVFVGDEVVTSGLGGVFPKGLLIGYIESVHADDSGLFQWADVIPKADLGTLTYVFVLAEQENPIDEYLRKMEFKRGAQE